MAKQANRMMIGGFVVIAIFILMASLVIFGSGRFFKQTETFVLHFEGSIRGLNVGAPVLFQGVQIGSVTNIVIKASRDDLKASVPVTIQIQPERFQTSDSRLTRYTPNETLPKLIDLGLRGVLTLQSFITGQLMIELDFHPDSPVVFRDTEKKYLEIPTIQSTTKRLALSLQQIDIEGLEQRVTSILDGIDRLVNAPEWTAAMRSFSKTMEQSQLLLSKVDTRFGQIADGMDSNLAEFESLLSDAKRQLNSVAERIDATLDNADGLIININDRVDPLAADTATAIQTYTELARDADAGLQRVASNLDKTLLATREIMAPDAPLVLDLRATLDEISEAARSLKILADLLAQQPESLIRGRE